MCLSSTQRLRSTKVSFMTSPFSSTSQPLASSVVRSAMLNAYPSKSGRSGSDVSGAGSVGTIAPPAIRPISIAKLMTPCVQVIVTLLPAASCG